MGILTKIKSVVLASTAAKIAAVSVTVVVLVGGVVGLAYPAAFSSAEGCIARAAMATFSEQTSTAEEIFGIKEFSAALKEQGAEVSAETAVEQLSVSGLGFGDITVPEVGLHLTARMTPQQEIRAEAEITAANTSILSADAYLNQDQLQVNVPKLFKSVLTLNYNDASIENKMKASYAAEYLELSDAQIEEFVQYLPKWKRVVSMEEVEKKLLELLVDGLKDNITDVKFAKEGKEELRIGGLNQECSVYSATMPARDVTGFLYEATVCIKAYMKELCAEQGVEEAEVDQAFHVWETVVHQLKFNMKKDVVFSFYVLDDRLVEITAGWTMDWVDEIGPCEHEGSLDVKLAPEGNPVENMWFHIKTPVHYDDTASRKGIPQVVDFTYEVETEHTESLYSVECQIKYNNMPMNVAFEYKKPSGDFSFKAADQKKSIKLDGAVVELKKGKKISLEVENYRYVEGNTIEEKEIELSLFLQPLQEKVSALDGSKQDVLAMTKRDVNALEKELKRNVTKLLFSLLGLFQ